MAKHEALVVKCWIEFVCVHICVCVERKRVWAAEYIDMAWPGTTMHTHSMLNKPLSESPNPTALLFPNPPEGMSKCCIQRK